MLQRQPPHMPVPSTMIGLRLTSVAAVDARHLGHGAHHDERPDGEDPVDVLVPLDQARERVGHLAVHAVAAVVRGDDELVAEAAHLVLQDQEVLLPRPNHPDDVVAGLAMPAEQVVQHGDAGAATDAHDGADVLDMLRHAEGPAQVLDGVADAEGREHGRALADDLEDDGDGAVGRVAVGDGERHPLPRLVHAQDDELPRAYLPRDLRGLEGEADEIALGELLPVDDRVHGPSPRPDDSMTSRGRLRSRGSYAHYTRLPRWCMG